MKPVTGVMSLVFLALVTCTARAADRPQPIPIILDTDIQGDADLFNGLRSKASFDQTAVLYAVRGWNGALNDFWDLKTNGYLHVFADGSNEWRPQPDKNHAYLIKKMAPAAVAKVIEDLMLEPPSDSR